MSQLLNRNVGCEFEGYTTSNPRLYNVRHAEKKGDGSLRNRDWSSPAPDWGIEIACNKTKDISHILESFEDVQRRGWHVDQYAGTHVHVEVEDYTLKDKAKMMMFGADLGAIPFLFVQNYRWNNGYCRIISNSWSNIFNQNIYPIAETRWTNSRSTRLNDFISDAGYWVEDYDCLYCDKYNWINVHTRYPTIEFRLFHAVETEHDIVNFVTLAHNMVELVKNSSVEQLKFIASEITNAPTAIDMGKKFLEALGMSQSIPMFGTRVRDSINTVLAESEIAV